MLGGPKVYVWLETSSERHGPFSSRVSGKNKKLQSLRYTAARLFEKGVLLEIEDLPLSQYVPPAPVG